MVANNKKIIVIFLLQICAFFFLPLFSLDEVVHIGGKNGWQSLSLSQNIVSTKGLFGYEAKSLATNDIEKKESLDLVLNFDGAHIQDDLGRYYIEDMFEYRKSQDAKTGTEALLSLENNPFVLKGTEDSLFGTSGYKSSFSISFWIKPFLVQSQENLFSWNSSRNTSEGILYQSIQAGFFKGKMQWQFSNIFASKNQFETQFQLEGIETLIPNTWSHHSFVFNETDETIAYYVNGFLQDVKSVKNLKAFLGIPSNLSLCKNYTGLLDAFVIDKTDFEPKVTDAMYSKQRGRFETQPIDLESFGAGITKLDAKVNLPEQTAVALFVRAGDNFYEWTESYPSWQAIQIGEKPSGLNGRYAQIAGELYADGAGKYTPTITEVSLFYQKVTPPLAPYSIKAKEGDGFIDISWAKNIDENTAGYLIYYGEKPGEYLGRFALEGTSPIKIDMTEHIRISGLENGKIYYFAIRAYSAIDERIIGPFSKEVWARPRNNKGAFYE